MLKNKNLLIIVLIIIVNALGYGIIIPIVYSYSKHFGLSDFENGLLFAIFSVCQFFATPIIGRLSDKYGRKPMLLLSITGTALSFLLMAFAPNAFVLFLARALDGITAGNIPVAMAVISDSTTDKQRAKGFGLVGAGFSFGFIFGPAIAGLTVGISETLPFLIAAAISIIAVILTALVLPETNKHIGQVKQEKLFDFKKLWHALFDPNVGATFIITFLFFTAFSCAIIYGFQPFTKNILHITTSENALLFSVFGIVGLISQALIVGNVSKLLGPKKAIALSFFIVGSSFLAMYFTTSLAFFIGEILILGLLNGIAQTLIPTIVSRETDAQSQGTMLGINTSYQSIGMILGPLVGGALATLTIAAPFLGGAAACFLCLVLTSQIMRKGISKESAFER